MIKRVCIQHLPARGQGRYFGFSELRSGTAAFRSALGLPHERGPVGRPILWQRVAKCTDNDQRQWCRTPLVLGSSDLAEKRERVPSVLDSAHAKHALPVLTARRNFYSFFIGEYRIAENMVVESSALSVVGQKHGLPAVALSAGQHSATRAASCR